MSTIKLEPGVMNYLEEEVNEHFDFVILERGWNLYRDDAVDSLVVMDNEIHAEVWGTRLYKVMLDSFFFVISDCTCPYDGYCKHMAAVFFALQAHTGLLPELFFDGSRRHHMEQQHNHPQLATNSKTKAAQHRQKLKQQSLRPVPSSTAAEWHLFFGQFIRKFALDSPYELQSIYRALNDELSECMTGWPAMLQALIQLHKTLFLFRLVEQMGEVRSGSYYADYHRQILRQVTDVLDEDLIQITTQTDTQEAEQNYASLVQSIREYLVKHAFPSSPTHLDWQFIYRALWGNLLSSTLWIEQEQIRLRKEITASKEQTADTAYTVYRTDYTLSALAFFEVLAGRDEQAMALIDQQQEVEETYRFFPYLHTFKANELWDRLHTWLRWLLPAIQQEGPAYVQSYCDFWIDVMENRPDDEEWMGVMSSLLPASYAVYTEQLLHKKMYRAWVDVHLYLVVSPLSIDPSELLIVEKADITLLLPLYHMAIESYIMQKSRSEYRIAVRLLKKLRQYYKRLKKPQEWEQYIHLIVKQYSRLRALQEELRKGRLVS